MMAGQENTGVDKKINEKGQDEANSEENISDVSFMKKNWISISLVVVILLLLIIAVPLWAKENTTGLMVILCCLLVLMIMGCAYYQYSTGDSKGTAGMIIFALILICSGFAYWYYYFSTVTVIGDSYQP